MVQKYMPIQEENRWTRLARHWSWCTESLTTTASGFCKAATWPTTDGMYWPLTFLVMAEAGAQAIAALLLATGVQRFALCGHSFGSLIALHLAATCPERVSHLIMVGTAFPMRVSPALLQTAQSDPAKAIAMVTQFSHSTLAPPPSALGPGTWLYGSTRALMRRVLASNPHENVFHIGFKACDEYLAGYTAMAAVVCPVLFILGEFDQMTLPKNASGLIDQARQRSVVTVAAGHMIMNEAPDATLTAITAFLH
jgi:pimeloyl-ACP methyl ester carboxylesterase